MTPFAPPANELRSRCPRCSRLLPHPELAVEIRACACPRRAVDVVTVGPDHEETL